MKIRPALLLLFVVAAAACTQEPDRQWMKPGPYTVEEFHRDTADCTRRGELDADCMQAKGWIAVQPLQPEPPKKQGGGGGRTYQIPSGH
jgi:hypothetical protein